jgi:transcriptional regulator GlxA family with amidase domain
MASSRTLRKLCRVRDLIRDRLGEELTLSDLSVEADLSEWHFLRTFREAFGETPHAFLTRLRLERAKELLTISSRPVREICFDVGFTRWGASAHCSTGITVSPRPSSVAAPAPLRIFSMTRQKARQVAGQSRLLPDL